MDFSFFYSKICCKSNFCNNISICGGIMQYWGKTKFTWEAILCDGSKKINLRLYCNVQLFLHNLWTSPCCFTDASYQVWVSLRNSSITILYSINLAKMSWIKGQSTTLSARQYSAHFSYKNLRRKSPRTKLWRNSYMQRVSKFSRTAVLTTSTARKLQLTTAEKSHSKPCEAGGPVVIKIWNAFRFNRHVTYS